MDQQNHSHDPHSMLVAVCIFILGVVLGQALFIINVRHGADFRSSAYTIYGTPPTDPNGNPLPLTGSPSQVDMGCGQALSGTLNDMYSYGNELIKDQGGKTSDPSYQGTYGTNCTPTDQRPPYGDATCHWTDARSGEAVRKHTIFDYCGNWVGGDAPPWGGTCTGSGCTGGTGK